MPTAARKRENLPFNRDVLKWARERLHLTQDAAADRAGVKPQQLREWESGPKFPTVKQARRLAKLYDRPFLEFFSRERPEVQECALVPDYRMHRGTAGPTEQYELIRIQQEAEEIRLNAIDLFEMLDEQPRSLPSEFYGTIDDDAEQTAARVRSILNLSLTEQLGLSYMEKNKFVDILRRKFEEAGILVIKNTGLANFSSRGMCFFARPLPIIIFSSESPSAQAFTLAHELGHVVLQKSALSGEPGGAAPSAKKTEDWCDAFAAAFLAPADAVKQLYPKPKTAQANIPDDQLNKLARKFAISPHAMLIRLVNLGYVKASYYWDVKRPRFLEQEAAFKGGGRSKYYGSRYRTWRGDMYTGLVLEAWSNGVITNHNAAEFMGIKNISHLAGC